LVKTCLRSAESTRWNDRCAPTWSGNSMLILLSYAIFNIASSKILPDPDLIPHSSPSTPFTHQSSSNASSSSSSAMPFLAPRIPMPKDAPVIPGPSIPAYASSCSQNQPLDQGSATGPNLAVESAPCALSVSGGTSACIHQIWSRLLQVGLQYSSSQRGNSRPKCIRTIS